MDEKVICPFCGSEMRAEILWSGGVMKDKPANHAGKAICCVCGASGPGAWGETKDGVCLSVRRLASHCGTAADWEMNRLSRKASEK